MTPGWVTLSDMQVIPDYDTWVGHSYRRHAEIHRTSDNDEKKSQCPVNVGKTPDKMSGISIYPKFVVKSLIFLWFHNELTSSITSSWSKVNNSAIIPETLILPNLPSWLKISSDFPYLWRHIHGNPRVFQGTRSYKGEVFSVFRVCFPAFFYDGRRMIKIKKWWKRG